MDRVLAVAVALALALAACSDDAAETPGASEAPDSSEVAATNGSTSTTAVAETTSPVPTTEESPGCGTTFAPGPTDQTVISDGRERLFRLALPSAYTGDELLPLILNWHGHGSNAGEQAVYSGLEAEGPAAGYAVMTPQGTGDPALWNIINRADGLDDVAFADDLIDWAAEHLCIDIGRVYSTGISNGAGMSDFLACEIPERIAAIAPVAGVNLVAPCAGPPMSVVAFHGLVDAVVPYGGGSVMGRADLPFPGVDDAMSGWAGRAGCSTSPHGEAASTHVERRTFEGCDSGAEVVLYAVSDGGHTWPGAIDIPRLGPVTDEIDATDLILAFFDAH